MTDGMFNENQGGPDQGNTENSNPIADTLHIGEGKKYATIADADKAIAFKDDHIAKIEAENAELRKKTMEARTIDDILNSIDNQNLPQGSTESTNFGNQQTLDLDAVTQTVKQKIEEEMRQTQAKAAQEANIAKVKKELVDKYGEKTADVFKAKEAELGIDLTQLAAQSPTAVMEYFKSPVQPMSTYSSSVNTEAVANINGGPQYGTHEYWNKMHREGKISLDKKLAEQHKSLAALGPEKYYGK